MSPYARYLKAYALLSTAVLATVVGFNWIVDPYGLYRSPTTGGFNAIKPEVRYHHRMVAAHALYRIKPEALILGGSRSYFGLDPAHPGWDGARCYNAALLGSNMYETLRYFQHAQAVGPLRRVVLGLDFFMFNIERRNQPDFDEQRLAVTADGRPNPRGMRDLVTTLFSLDGLRSAVKTVSQQDFAPEEILNDEMATTSFRGIERHGQREVFRQNEKAYMTEIWLPPPSRRYRFAAGGASTFDYFRAIVRRAHLDDIELHLLISPSHARQWEALRTAGLWDRFEFWKQELVRINESEARAAGRPAFPLWDFSGYHSISTEPVPAAGDKSARMRWYWESSHYRRALGDLVLDRVLGHERPGQTPPADFGVRIGSDNIDRHLARIRAAQRHYRATHPQDVREIEALAAGDQHPSP